jgi:hypothetical protein
MGQWVPMDLMDLMDQWDLMVQLTHLDLSHQFLQFVQ